MLSDTRLGEQLVRMGVIDATELRAMLSVQSELRAAHGRAVLDPLSRRFRLGRLLVDSGVIDEATLSRALAESRRSGRRLGEALVDAGAISTEVLQRSLERQRRLMAIALSSVALSTSPNTNAADTATVRVVASVTASASIESQRLPSEVAVSAEDIALGYVDVPVEIGVRSNHAVVLGFSANSRDVARIDVTSGSTYIAQRERGMRSKATSLQLRLRLAPGAQPGRIAFPVSVSLTPA
ncbi:MAG TPA: hypothetical protein VFK84_18770 [Burkholderiales bacterium]|nr:hypothetical protein [Burkholderiales bacterium]